MFLSIFFEVFCRSVILILLLIVFIIFIIVQDTLHAGGRLAAIENHTLGFLIFVQSTGGSVAVCPVCVADS